MTEILNIFADKPVEPSSPIGAELYPTLPVIIEPNPVDVEIPEDEDEEIVMPEVIDYGIYDPRENDVDFRFSAPALNGVPALGMPISAYRVLLGSYSFTYGAHDHISVNQKHVIVRFPVADRNGTIKQTTGSDDVDYQWEGNIVSRNIQDDMKAIRAISEAGEPVDFFYLGQKKKVLLEQFDYEVFHNCRAKYTIKVTEYYPQKIKFIPVRVDPLIPERWGILPPVAPIDPNAPDRDDCRCSLQYKDGTGQADRIPGNKIVAQNFEFPEGILVEEVRDMFGDLDGFIDTYLKFFAASKDAIYRRILAIALNKLFRWVKEKWSLTCLMWLFRDCPREQEKFYKDILLLYMLNGVYVQYLDYKYPLLHLNKDKDFVDGSGNYDKILEDMIDWFSEHLVDEFGVKLSRDAIYAWLNPPNTCSEMAKTVSFVETSRVAILELCTIYKHVLQARNNAAKKGHVVDERWPLVEILARMSVSTVVFEPPALELSQACQEWCEKRRIEGLNPGDSTPHTGVNP